MAVGARAEPDPLAKRSRLTGVRRTFAPVLDARGQARWMLWLGAAITLAFVFIAVFAPVLAPLDAPKHLHNHARATFVEIGGVVQPAPAPRFSATPAAPPRAAGRANDSAAIFSDWGIAPQTLQSLREAGMVT